jgi:hypothetical protein
VPFSEAAVNATFEITSTYNEWTVAALHSPTLAVVTWGRIHKSGDVTTDYSAAELMNLIKAANLIVIVFIWCALTGSNRRHSPLRAVFFKGLTWQRAEAEAKPGQLRA